MTTEALITSDLAIAPGEYLQEVLEELNVSQADLARRMGRPAQAINEMIKGTKAITPETALQLAQVLNVPAHIWTNLEAEYRLILAKQTQQRALKAEQTLLKDFCYSELCKLGLVEDTSNKDLKVLSLRQFFAVAALQNITGVKAYAPAFRLQQREGLSPQAIAAWLRAGELLAKQQNTQPYSKTRLQARLPALRALTKVTEPNQLLAMLRAHLADCGVALVLIPAFAKTGISGATFWLNPQKAVVMMSMRGAWSDMFWFSLFHEIGHILLHNHRLTFLEDAKGTINPAYEQQEQEADNFAQQLLIAPEPYQQFVAQGDFSPQAILHFAQQIDLFAGIVTGRLQHDQLLPYTVNTHRIRYKWV